MIRQGIYHLGSHEIEVVRDVEIVGTVPAEPFRIDGTQPQVGALIPLALMTGLQILEQAMPTYNAIIDRIAAYLVLHHGVATELSNEAAAKLVRECDLSTILVKGIASGALGESPRQTFGS